MLSRNSTRSLSSVLAIFRDNVEASLAIIDACLCDISLFTTLRRVSERMLFISSRLMGSILVMLYDLKPCSDLMRSTALDDVLVEGEDDVRCELPRPCVQIIGYSVFLKSFVPIGKRACIDIVLI